MPVVLRHEGYRFFFFSTEGESREPIHVHVRKAERVAKIWLEPQISVADSYRLKSSELRRLQDVVEANQELIRSKWHEHFGD